MITEIDESRRAFILGLDGVPWGPLQRMTDTGSLPNFERLATEGASGPLGSTTPANTPVAWPSIATGTWPDKHGLYEFMNLDSGYTQSPFSSTDIQQPTLWELLSPATVANVPMTYPVHDAGEETRMVSGMMTPEITEDAVAPESLRSEFERELEAYDIDIPWQDYAGQESAFLDDLDALLDDRRDLLELLMADEDWRLFFFVFVAPDRLQHLIWDDETLLSHYEKLDSILGDVMEYCETTGSTLYVVSDHGFAPIEKVISVNRLLADEGLLQVKDSDGTRGVMSTLGVEKEQVQGALRSVGITDERLVRTLPKPVVDFFAERIPGDHGLYDVDFEQTTAFHHGLGSIYINDTERFENGTVPPEQVSTTKQEVMTVLDDARDPETGDKLLRVYDGADRFPHDPDSPDVVVEATDGYHVEPKLNDSVVEPATDIAAYHRPDGVFFAWGDDIQAGSTVEGADVVDVAPTVLHSLGADVPVATDGSVLKGMFRPDSDPATTAVQTAQYAKQERSEREETESETVEERLRGLGYME